MVVFKCPFSESDAFNCNHVLIGSCVDVMLGVYLSPGEADFAVDSPSDFLSLLNPGPISRVRIDLTERCNLRCTYCAVSANSYRGVDMVAELADKTIAAITALAQHNQLSSIDVNGHGETTFLPDWVQRIEPLFAISSRVQIQSNFAKEFSEHELDALARMQRIVVSIDSADPAILRKYRRRVDLRRIITNVAGVRARAGKNGDNPPQIDFACGLYDKNTPHVEGLAHLAVELGVQAVHFWNLQSYPHFATELAEEERVRGLDELEDSEFELCMSALISALGVLGEAGIVVTATGGFIEALWRRLAADER